MKKTSDAWLKLEVQQKKDRLQNKQGHREEHGPLSQVGETEETETEFNL